MAITADDFKKALEALENGTELYDYHLSSINAERQTGIDKHRKANKDAVRWKSLIQKLGLTDDQDAEEFIEGIVSKLEADTNTTGEIGDLKKQLIKLQKNFEQSQADLNAERESNKSLAEKSKRRTIETILSKPVNDKFYSGNFIIKSLIADGLVDLNEDEQVVFNRNGTTIGMDEGLKWLTEINSDAVKNTQRPGAGSPPSNGNGGGGGNGQAKYTMDQIKSMTPDQIRADIAAVNDSMRQHQTVKS